MNKNKYDVVNQEEEDLYVIQKKAYQRGKQGLREKMSVKDCPYEEGSDLEALWLMGYNYLREYEK